MQVNFTVYLATKKQTEDRFLKRKRSFSRYEIVFAIEETIRNEKKLSASLGTF